MLSNKIYKADVIKHLKKLKDNEFDLIIADPPYNQSIDEWDIFNDKKYWSFMNSWIELAMKKLKNGGSIYIFNNPMNSAKTLPIIIKNNGEFRNWITWYKKDGFGAPKSKFRTMQETILFFTKGGDINVFNYNDVRLPYNSKRIEAASKKGILKNGKRWFPNPDGKLRSDVWEFSSQRHKEKISGKTQKHWHPTPKPHDLIEIIIKVSTNNEDKVLDLFSGSGATSIVSKKMKRNSIGIELNDFYCKKIKELLK